MGVSQTSFTSAGRQPVGTEEEGQGRSEGRWLEMFDFMGRTVGPFGHLCAALHDKGRTPGMIQRPSGGLFSSPGV